MTGRFTRFLGQALWFIAAVGVVVALFWANATRRLDLKLIFGAAKTAAQNTSAKVREGVQALGAQPPSGTVAAQAAECRETLRRLHTAKLALRSKTGYEVRDVSWDAVLKEMEARGVPRCPGGGTYLLGTMQELPRCTLGSGLSTEPDDDHLIRE